MNTHDSPLGLSDLAQVTLSQRQTRFLGEAAEHSLGSAAWRRRKEAETRDLFALEAIAPRFQVSFVDLQTTLRVMVVLRCPVPCLDENGEPLQIADEATLGISYPEEALRQPQPGFAFVQIKAPSNVFHANVAHGSDQRLCLGTSLPAGVRLREIVLASYAALTLQNVQIDERDAAGVMNITAARWWQGNPEHMPLSRVPFLASDDLEGE